MGKLDELYNDLLQRDVALFTGSYHFSEETDAVTIKMDGNFGVFLDIDLIKTASQELVTVSHEWAHVAGDATYGVDCPEELRVFGETKANRLQIKKLTPFEEMRSAFQSGITARHELAELFGVTEEFIEKAYRYYSEDCGMSF